MVDERLGRGWLDSPEGQTGTPPPSRPNTRRRSSRLRGNYTCAAGRLRTDALPDRQNYMLAERLMRLEAGSGIEPLYEDLQSSA
jgi:hypothetical protein